MILTKSHKTSRTIHLTSNDNPERGALIFQLLPIFISNVFVVKSPLASNGFLITKKQESVLLFVDTSERSMIYHCEALYCILIEA